LKYVNEAIGRIEYNQKLYDVQDHLIVKVIFCCASHNWSLDLGRPRLLPFQFHVTIT